MYSKVGKTLIKDLQQKSTKSFGVRKLFHDFVFRDDKSNPFYQVAALDPLQPLKSESRIISERVKEYQVSQLSNGIRVLTESASSPSRVDLGILLEVGTRDETNETSGSLLSIKNTYFKTTVNTNETVNYGVIQMSGGDFDMDYDQETTYWKAHCLAHDVVDIFKIMTDCALEPRSVVAANVALVKNQGTHKLEDQLNTGEVFNEAIFKTAFGQSGLGLPLRGFRHNIGNLTAYTLQKFQQQNINPNRIIVSAAGVENHQEFVDLANEALSYVKPYKGKATQRTPTEYRGGEVRSLNDTNDLVLALLFPTVDWKSKDLATYQLLHVLLGGRGNSVSSRLQRNIVNKHSYVDFAEAVNFNFSDAGLFGVKIQGAAESGTELLNDLVREIKSLTSNISKDELATAKQILKTNVYLALQRSADRLEEATRNVRIFDQVRLDKYSSAIDSVTAENVSQAVSQIISKTPTLIAHGGQANRLPSFDQLQNSLKQ